MGRPRQGERGDTAADLRRAAELEFAAHGFDGARLEDIATRVGLRRPSLFSHYPTKEALYEAVIASVVLRLREAVFAGVAAPGTFRDRLGMVIGTFADALYDNAAPAQIFARELLESHGASGEVVRNQVIPLLDLVEGFVRHAGREVIAPDVDVRLAVLDIAGAMVLHAIGAPMRALLWTGEDARELDRAASRAHFVALAERLLLADRTGLVAAR